VACMGEERKVHKIIAGKPEGMRTLGRPRRRWEDLIGVDLRDIGWGSVVWIKLAQNRNRWRALVMIFRVLSPRRQFVRITQL
jgi:hypothetical protein